MLFRSVVVGERVAARTTPVRLFGATLIVETVAQDWRRQLARMALPIADKLNAAAGKVVLQDIEFRVAVPAERRPPRRAASAAGNSGRRASGRRPVASASAICFSCRSVSVASTCALPRACTFSCEPTRSRG
mgnify:CR=1 FL=1